MNKSTLQCLKLVCAAVVLTSSVAQADDKFTFGSNLWAQYKYNMTEGSKHNNGFDLYRVYFKFGAKLSDDWSSMLVLDAASRLVAAANPGASQLTPFIKHGYIDGKNVLGEGSTLRFGMYSHAFKAVAEGSLKTRWLAKTLIDETGALGGSDIAGVGYMADFMDKKIKFQLDLHNGAELNKAVTDNNLALAATVILKPFEGDLTGLGFAVSENNKFSATTSTTDTVTGLPVFPKSPAVNTLFGGVFFEHEKVDAGAEIAHQKTSGVDGSTMAYQGTANFKFMENVSLFGRFATGNDNYKAVKGNTFTVGPTCTIVPKAVSTAILFESVAANDTLKDAAEGAGADAPASNNTIVWNWAANF